MNQLPRRRRNVPTTTARWSAARRPRRDVYVKFRELRRRVAQGAAASGTRSAAPAEPRIVLGLKASAHAPTRRAVDAVLWPSGSGPRRFPGPGRRRRQEVRKDAKRGLATSAARPRRVRRRRR